MVILSSSHQWGNAEGLIIHKLKKLTANLFFQKGILNNLNKSITRKKFKIAKLRGFIALIIFLSLASSCSFDMESKYQGAVRNVDGICLYKKLGNEYCPIKIYKNDEIQGFLGKIKSAQSLSEQKTISGEFKLSLMDEGLEKGKILFDSFHDDYVEVVCGNSNGIFELGISLEALFYEILNDELLDCNFKKANLSEYFGFDDKILYLDSLSPKEFIKLLPLNNWPRQRDPFLGVHFPWMHPKWVSENDLSFLMGLIESDQPAHSIMSEASSYYPINRWATIGGHATILVESFKSRKQYSSLYIDFQGRKDWEIELMDWWGIYQRDSLDSK